MNTTIADIIQTGMNNPDCAFFVGQFFGQFLGIKIFFYLVIFGIFFRMADKMAFEPFAEWVKRKVWRK